MVRAVDELIDDGAITEATWAVLAAELDEKQLLDLDLHRRLLRDHVLAVPVGRARAGSGRARVPEAVQATRTTPREAGPVRLPRTVDRRRGRRSPRRARRRRQGARRRPEPRADARPAPRRVRPPGRPRPGRRAAVASSGATASMWIGAGTTQATIEASAEVAAAVPLLARATPLIGHFQIRNRGTIGGSIAHADPAAEYPAVALALDAELEAASPRGRRTLPAAEFFSGLWTTELAEDEILTGVRFPVWDGRCGHAVEELARRHGDFAIAGAVVVGAARRRPGPAQRDRAARARLDAGAGDARRKPRSPDRRSATSSRPRSGRRRCRRSSPSRRTSTGRTSYRRRVGAAMVARAWTRAVEEASRA